jgi:hypothetical protein
MNQNRFLRGAKQLLGSALDMSIGGYCFPGYSGGWEIHDGDMLNAVFMERLGLLVSKEMQFLLIVSSRME